MPTSAHGSAGRFRGAGSGVFGRPQPGANGSPVFSRAAVSFIKASSISPASGGPRRAVGAVRCRGRDRTGMERAMEPFSRSGALGPAGHRFRTCSTLARGRTVAARDFGGG